jgi:uncharacterized membrane protein (DUF2068 family)
VTDTPYNADPQRHPGRHLIALLEASKAVLALLAATGLEVLGPQPLRDGVNALIRRFSLDPDHGTLPSLLNMISPDAVHLAAAAMVAYGILHLFEAWGLWRAKAWASWLGCVTAGIYLPFDIFAIIRHPGWASWTVLVINLIVVGVLARDIRKRHGPAQPPA